LFDAIFIYLLSDVLQILITLPACPVEVNPNDPYGSIYCYIKGGPKENKWTFHPPSNRTDVVFSLKIIRYVNYQHSTDKTFMPDGKDQNWFD